MHHSNIQVKHTFRDTTRNKSTVQSNQIIGGSLSTLTKMKLLRVFLSLNTMVSYSWEHSTDFHWNKECYICIMFDFLGQQADWVVLHTIYFVQALRCFVVLVFFPSWEKVVRIRRPSLWIVVSMQESGSALLSASGLWKRSVSLTMKK